MKNIQPMILYLSSYIPYEIYNILIEKTNKVISPPAQKFHSSIVKGLEINGKKIHTLSINSFKANIKNSQDHSFYETPNNNFFSKVWFFIKVFSHLFFMKIKYKKVIIIVDYLIGPFYKISSFFCKIFSSKMVLIATDILDILIAGKKSDTQKIFKYSADGFILMTDKMNEYFQISDKPYIVLDGLIDSENLKHHIDYKSKSKIIMYAGNLDEIYGIKYLINSFLENPIKGFELHIYGVGNYSDKIKSISSKNPIIKFFGYKDKNFILQKEKESFLLVNPRPIDEIYSNYSFPSKVYEYMASGTVLLTSKLPTFPNGFEKFVYYFDTKQKDNLMEKMKEIVSLNEKTLEKKANEAFKFVSKEKNFIIQTKKISNLLECL
jgi:hypothetical protein